MLSTKPIPILRTLTLAILFLATACDSCEDKPEIESWRYDDSPPPRDSDGNIPGEYLSSYIREITPRENLQDPKSYDLPRLQFIWDADNDDEDSVWSIKIDGTDLRLTLAQEELETLFSKVKTLYTKGFGIGSRSPNGRYIFLYHDAQVSILDLQTKKLREIGDFITKGSPQFTDDGDGILFYNHGVLRLYRISTGTLEKFPYVFSEGTCFIARGKKQLIAVHPKEIKVYDFNAKLLKTLDIISMKKYGGRGIYSFSGVRPSLDGRLLYFSTSQPVLNGPSIRKSYIIKIDKPDKPLFEGNSFLNDVVFGPKGESVFYVENGDIMRLDLPTKDRIVFIGGDRRLIYKKKTGSDEKNFPRYGYLCLYNYSKGSVQ